MSLPKTELQIEFEKIISNGALHCVSTACDQCRITLGCDRCKTSIEKTAFDCITKMREFLLQGKIGSINSKPGTKK